MKECRQCRSLYDPAVNYCIYCGVQLYMRETVPSGSNCGNCGVVNAPNLQYCTGCGVPMQRGYAPEPPRHAQKKKRSLFKRVAILGVLACVAWMAYIGIIKEDILNKPATETLLEESDPAVEDITGEFYSGRAITIRGNGFGEFNPETSQVMIDGKASSILSWGESEVVVCIPGDIQKGKRTISIMNPPSLDKMTTKAEFMERSVKEVARSIVNVGEDVLIEGSGVKLFVPAGSSLESREIVISKYDTVVPDPNAYEQVLEEFEVTDALGNHLFFEGPVLFGIEVPEEEAEDSGIRYFDNAMGVWVNAETAYNPEDGMLYVKTTHFSGWQRFKNHVEKKIKNKVNETYESGKRMINYTYTAGKNAVNKAVELSEEIYVLGKDTFVEEFIGIGGEHVVVLYRSSDFDQDNSIRDTAVTAAAAYDHAYKEYENLFGAEHVPNYNLVKVLKTKDKGFFQAFLENRLYGSSDLLDTEESIVDKRLKVYIDPRYNSPGANYSILSGSVSMPSKYPANDLATTCAHELFHTVQHHQYGLKMLYMANGFKELAGKLEADPQVTRYQANNKWYFEATAEYASLFIGTQTGIDTLHSGIEASSPYYAFSASDSGQEYAMSAFIDYLVTKRNTEIGFRNSGFLKMWNAVLEKYSMASSVNVALDEYVRQQFGESSYTLYGEFWRDVITQASMPAFPQDQNSVGTAAVTGIADFVSLQKGRSMVIKSEGVGIYRMSFNDMTMPPVETDPLRSVWMEMSNKALLGDVYKLSGNSPSDRVDKDIQPVGFVNAKDVVLPQVLEPFSKGESFVLAAEFRGISGGNDSNTVKCMVSSVVWNNESEIQKKVKNTTLSFEDKLEFVVDLPKTRPGESPYWAKIWINGSEDFYTEVPQVEVGKPFLVDPPMYKDSNLPPKEVVPAVVIYKGENIVHIYQGIQPKDIEMDFDLAVKSGNLEEKDQAVFGVVGVPSGLQGVRYEWHVVTNPKGLLKNKMDDITGELSLSFSKAMQLDISVDVYGIVDGKEAMLGTARGNYTIDAKKEEVAVQKQGIDGKWKAYERAWAGGSNDAITSQTMNYTLSIGNGQFKLTVIAPTGESWDFVGYVRDYIDASGEQAYELVIDSGNSTTDYHQKNDLRENQNLEALYVDTFSDGNALSLGTMASRLYFERE